MSTATLTGAVKATDDTLRDWLEGLVTGEGDAPSQIIVSGALSVIPGVGQAMDLRDIVRGVITLARAPGHSSAWLEMAVTLVGCVPVAGDALKTTFRLLRRGDAMPRILDALSPAVRGNVERYFREIDWALVGSTVKGSFDKVLGAFVDGLDSWLVKTVLGRGEVQLLIEQLKQLRAQGPKMLDEAIAELHALWSKALGDKLPRSTAHATPPKASAPASTSGGGGTIAAEPKAAPKTVSRDRTDKPVFTPDKPRNEQRRAAKTKKSFESGVPAEHMTDYWVARTRRNLKKANNLGRLWEEWDREGRQGIDHVWVQSGAPARPGVIGETKSSLLGAFGFLAALPADIRSQLTALSADEASTPTPSGAPNIFHSQARDEVSPGKIRIEPGSDNEAKLKARPGLGQTKSKGVQMSHRWIARSLPGEQLTTAGLALLDSVQFAYRKRFRKLAPPYTRWVLMVTGRQKHLHELKQGHKHEIQPPLVVLPDGILAE